MGLQDGNGRVLRRETGGQSRRTETGGRVGGRDLRGESSPAVALAVPQMVITGALRLERALLL